MNAIVPKELLTATPGGLSLLVVSGGADGQVLTQQADGTYAPEAVSAGIGGSVGSTADRLVKSSGTGGSTVQSTGIAVDSSNNVSGVGTLSCGAITSSGEVSGSGSGYTAYIGGNGAIGAYFRTASGSIGFAAGALIPANSSAAYAPESLAFGLSYYRWGAVFATSANFSGLICAGTYTVSTLPSASANAYKFATVSDSSVTTFGSTVAGGGSSKVMVFSNGTNWTVCAA
ncbi:MAG: hypothetical protein E6R03_02895 [Hyphomicrobiaceae bacterium]|nr:MAG: hypothetical protein E6R03_02895 [Hyphomicrobiaceae bacterium]